MSNYVSSANEQAKLMEDAQKTVRKKRNNIIIQDLAMLAFLAGLFGACAVIVVGGEEMLMENIILFLLTTLGIILAAFHFRFLATAYSILLTTGYAIIKIALAFLYEVEIKPLNFAWIILPLITILSILLFLKNAYNTQILSDLLVRQIEALEAIDPLTKLFNRKSMYADLERQMAYARRNHVPLSLMVVTFKYSEELKEILTKVQYDELKVRLVTLVEDVVRLEDRVYSIGENGEIGIITFCDTAGSAVLSNRLRKNCKERKAFEGILDQALKVDLKIGYLEYNEEEHPNSIDLSKKTENELQYDV